MDEDSRARMLLEYEAARREFRSERWEEAEARLQRIVRIEPLFAAAHYLLGRTQMELKRYRSAVQSYLGAERAAIALNAAARSRLMRPGGEERLTKLDGARDPRPSRSPFPAELPFALGTALHRLGELEQAEREYMTALEINGKLGEAHNNLAVLYFSQGKVDDARIHASLAEKSGFRVHPRLKEGLYATR